MIFESLMMTLMFLLVLITWMVMFLMLFELESLKNFFLNLMRFMDSQGAEGDWFGLMNF